MTFGKAPRRGAIPPDLCRFFPSDDGPASFESGLFEDRVDQRAFPRRGPFPATFPGALSSAAETRPREPGDGPCKGAVPGAWRRAVQRSLGGQSCARPPAKAPVSRRGPSFGVHASRRRGPPVERGDALFLRGPSLRFEAARERRSQEDGASYGAVALSTALCGDAFVLCPRAKNRLLKSVSGTQHLFRRRCSDRGGTALDSPHRFPQKGGSDKMRQEGRLREMAPQNGPSFVVQSPTCAT